MQITHFLTLLFFAGFVQIHSPGPADLAAMDPTTEASDNEATESAERDGKCSDEERGLKCTCSWGNTGATAKCRGNKKVKWRLHVRCAYQRDYKSPWRKGPGRVGYECRHQVQSADIIWG